MDAGLSRTAARIMCRLLPVNRTPRAKAPRLIHGLTVTDNTQETHLSVCASGSPSLASPGNNAGMLKRNAER